MRRSSRAILSLELPQNGDMRAVLVPLLRQLRRSPPIGVLLLGSSTLLDEILHHLHVNLLDRAVERVGCEHHGSLWGARALELIRLQECIHRVLAPLPLLGQFLFLSLTQALSLLLPALP